MTLRDYTANVISASKVVPDGNFKDSKASGVWDINEALDLIKGGNWPNAANLNPAAFVDGLFSTDLWTSDGSSTQTITNNIDLSNKGGLVWIKDRSTARANVLVDTARISGNTDNYLMSDSTNAQTAHSNEFGDFTSTGYTLPRNTEAGYTNTNTGRDYVGWTFRKQPKFFDIVTYSGTGSNQNISHNLGSTPGMIIIKDTSASNAWTVYHRGVDSSAPEDYSLNLGSDAARDDATSYFNDTAPTSSVFTVGTTARTNNNGSTYVAYLFAHNNDDGGFGEPGDQDIIKCGSFTGNTSGTEVNLNFEPQFVMIKKSSASESWYVYDSMRGVATGGANSQDKKLRWNSNGAEGAVASPIIAFSANGFILESTDNEINGSGTYIYMAIRRGGMQTPTAASDVFNVVNHPNDASNVIVSPGFTTDFAITRKTDEASNTIIATRLMGHQILKTNDYAVQSDDYSNYMELDHQDGIKWKDLWGNQPAFDLHWKRARGFCDVVAYTGTGSAKTESHNLGVTPEMIWVKGRTHAENWAVYHKDVGATKYLQLNTTAAEATSSTRFNDTAPTSSVFSLGADNEVNMSGQTFVAYLFATAAGVSKVGSYSGNGNDGRVIDCGFTSSAKFILIKCTSNAQSWFTFNTDAGIAAGNDARILFDDNAAEYTGADYVDADSSGFIVNNTNGDLNDSGREYIFYAVA